MVKLNYSFTIDWNDSLCITFNSVTKLIRLKAYHTASRKT